MTSNTKNAFVNTRLPSYVYFDAPIMNGWTIVVKCTNIEV
jgi:hypothetical protein